MLDHWIADRASRIEASGIRKIFELGQGLKDPINLSIGQPHFEVPEPIRNAAKAAIDRGDNGYTVTQGIPELRSKLQADVQRRLPGQDREVLVTTGTSGAVMLALCATVNPGEEVILFDPYFVAYPHLVTLAGGTSIVIDTYPDFRIDVNKVRAAITPRTKAILFSSPSNPTGVTTDADTLRDLANLAREKGVLLIADEIYRSFWYDGHFAGRRVRCERVGARWFRQVVWDHGLAIGVCYGPKRLIEEMAKLSSSRLCEPVRSTPASRHWTSMSLRSSQTTSGSETSCSILLREPTRSSGQAERSTCIRERPGDRHGIRSGGSPSEPSNHPRHCFQPEGQPLSRELRGLGSEAAAGSQILKRIASRG